MGAVHLNSDIHLYYFIIKCPEVKISKIIQVLLDDALTDFRRASKEHSDRITECDSSQVVAISDIVECLDIFDSMKFWNDHSNKFIIQEINLK